MKLPIARHRTASDARHARAYDFLHRHVAGVLCTVDPNGEPHGAVIYFAVDTGLAITFTTRKGTKKADNVEHMNHAMLTVFDEKHQTVVQVQGIVSEVTDASELRDVFNHTLSASQHSGRSAVPPVDKVQGGGFIGYRLMPVQVRISAYARGSGQASEVIDIPR